MIRIGSSDCLRCVVVESGDPLSGNDDIVASGLQVVWCRVCNMMPILFAESGVYSYEVVVIDKC